MKYFVYILFSAQLNVFYKGFSTNKVDFETNVVLNDKYL